MNWFGRYFQWLAYNNKNWNKLTIKFKVRGTKRCDDRFVFRIMLIHKSKRLKSGDRIMDNYIGRKIRVFKSFINSNTFLGIESL